MNKNLSIILAALVPLAAVLYILWGQREPQPAKVVAVQPAVIPSKKQASANSDVENRKAIFEQQKRQFDELEREGVLHAQKFAQKSTPESVRQSAIDNLKSKEKRYRDLFESLNIPQVDGDKVLEIVLERNIQCDVIVIDANTESTFERRELLRSNQTIPNGQARQDMSKIIGEEKVKKLERLEQQFHDELIKRIKSSVAD